MKNRIKILFLTIILQGAACKKSVYVAPVVPDTVSFSGQIIPLFNQYCNNPGCHSGTQPQGNLNLTSSLAYQQLFSKSMIDTNNPSGSLLYAQMNSTTRPMPPTGRLDTFPSSESFKMDSTGGEG